MRFKVGQKVVVKDCINGANFENGDIVEIVQIGTDYGEYQDCYGAISPWDKCKWYLYEDEIGPVTNADKIRSMTDEELTDFFLYDEVYFCSLCKYYGTTCDGYGCRESMLKWLKQPVKGE